MDRGGAAGAGADGTGPASPGTVESGTAGGATAQPGMPATGTAAEEQAWNRDQLAQPVDAPRFRVWRYEVPAVVLGCSQRRLYAEVERRLADRLELVQRESGGGAVLTGPWLVGASAVLPKDHPWARGGLVESYREWGRLHVEALQALGVPACAVSPAELPAARQRVDALAANVDWACFSGLSPWEVVDGQGRKLVGLAQRRRQAGLGLVAGTLVGRPDWSLLCEAMGRPQDEPALKRRTVSAEEVAGRAIEPQRYASVLATLIERALGDAAASPV